MDLTLNDAQLLVLRWVADGADLDNPPSATFKTSAVALCNRGLVDLDKRRGQWRVAITDAGTFYLEHGRHPKDESSKPKPPTPSRSEPAPAKSQQKRELKDTTAKQTTTEPVPSPSDASDAKAKPAPVVKDETIPIPEQVRRPHRAIREIVDHKARLDAPAEQRQRALLILHALVQEALRRGWTVTANPSTFQRDPWNGRRTRVSPGSDLFTIDAGHTPATIRLRMQQKRVDHVPTEEELAKEARSNWRSYPRHDYIATDRMRLEIRAGPYDVLSLDDTVATRIEDKLLRAIDKIQQISVAAREAAERRRQEEIRRAEQQRRAEELRKRAARYTNWAETLEQLRGDLVRHRQLAETVADLREAIAGRGPEHQHAAILGEYLAWAEQHLEASDPLRRIRLPQAEHPDLTYDEWHEWTRQNPYHW